MQLINQKMSVSIQKVCIAKHYLMPNNVVMYHFKSIVSLILWWQAKRFWSNVGVAHAHDRTLIVLCNERKYRLLN